MSATVRMRPPVGVDEANHGVERFTKRDDGSIWVSPEAVEPLMRVAGFMPWPLPEGAIHVHASGVVVEPDGTIDIPIESVDAFSQALALRRQ